MLGYKVHHSNELENLLRSQHINLIILSIPSIKRFKRTQILKRLRLNKVRVQTLPSIFDIVGGKVDVSDIKELDVNDILNREVVPPKKGLLLKNIN